MNPLPRALPRALHRARLMTAGALTAATLLVGAIGIHLADTQSQTVAASTGSSTGTSTTSSGTDDTSAATSQSGTSSDSGSSDDSTSSDTTGFTAVAPMANANGQAQTGSGGS